MERTQRKEKEYNRRRAEILEQAEKIFAAKGFYRATVAEIAEASGYAVGTIYQFFAGKEDLFRTMVCEKLDMMYSGIREAAKREKNAEEKIRALVETHFRFVEENADFCAIFIRREGTAFSEGNDSLKEKIVADYLGHVGFIEAIVRKGIADGHLRRLPSRSMAFTLAGMINAFTFSWMYTQGRESLSSKAGLLVDIYLQGVGMGT